MELLEFLNEVFCYSHLEETRIYPKRFIGASAQNTIYKKAVHLTEKGKMEFFENSKPNQEISLAYGIGQKEVEKYIVQFMKPSNIVAVINNTSEKFVSDNDELYLCAGYVLLKDLYANEGNYSGLAKNINLLHFYFKFGFQDNGNKMIVVSFHKMIESHNSHYFFRNSKGGTDYYFDDSKMENPQYKLLKSYVSAWMDKVYRHCSIFSEKFEPFSEDNVRGKKCSFVLRGKNNANLTDDEMGLICKMILKFKFPNLYTVRMPIRKVSGNNGIDVVVNLEYAKNEGEIE